MDEGPRIYNLFPLLAGPVARWHDHLPRIAAMGFSWVYLNPFHAPGFSGSLYAVKDYDRLNPVFQGDSPESPKALLKGFVAAAREHGLAVMMDLVVNHTSKDSLLVDLHPDWFARNADGSLRSPCAVDPDDPEIVTEWGDLAEIDFADEARWPEIVDFFGGLARRHAEMGFAGFRCDAAYKVPAEVWRGVVGRVREAGLGAVFAAETLGCTPDQVSALGSAGFDLLFNSAKWWDWRAPWLLEQYDLLRAIAPSIAFPESHDTPRLVDDCPEGADVLAWYKLKAMFAAWVSSGWMMPVGFEYGFARRLDVVTTRPEDWETPHFDLTGFIGALNRVKAARQALNHEGRMELLTAPDDAIVAMVKHGHDGGAALVALINPDPHTRHGLDLALVLAPTGLMAEALLDITPEGAGAAPALFQDLAPLEMRLLASAPVRTPTLDACAPATVLRPGEGVDATILGATHYLITIQAVQPALDGGHPVKREVGDTLDVGADILKEGHQQLAARVLYRPPQGPWCTAPMRPQGNDRWVGAVPLDQLGRTRYTVEAWVDDFETWRDDLLKRRAAGQDVAAELADGRALVAAALTRAQGADSVRLRRMVADLDRLHGDELADLLLSSLLRGLMAHWPDRAGASRYAPDLDVVVERVAARFAAWYEMMPRSQGADPHKSATFKDCERRLPEIARMGFDVVYLTPIHPIGRVNRKGPDNTVTAGPDDPGSPYAIGAAEGGHKSVHPDLGTLDDFRHFLAKADSLGLEVALDLALHCAPDHPYVREHPEWFVFRADGTIRYAENPPKKYQDIVNFNFLGPHAPALWREILDVVLFWAALGVRIFRVDNPHTKPVPLWQWLIRAVQAEHPDVIFLSEAFTRPKMMALLAKIGFSQSYTYFTWRTFKHELTAYLEELTRSELREYFRPHFFPTTPDILPPYLQTGGRPAFRIRLVLAATLSSLYGLYNGYELCEAAAIPGKEEYLHSEKYQYKVWDWNRPGHIKDDVTRLNHLRRANPALQDFSGLSFHPADDDQVLFYAKMTPDRSNIILVAVNLDPFDAHEAVLSFPLQDMGVPPGETFAVEELLTGRHHLWRGADHWVRLDPQVNPAEIYRVTVWTSVDYRSPCL